jgi:hypothetical protein
MLNKSFLRYNVCMKKKDFKDWKYSEINKEFGYKRIYHNFEILETWLKAENPIGENEKIALLGLQERLFLNADAWNEDELKFLFLSPLLYLVNFDSEHFKVFTQRKLSETIGDWFISGIFDFAVAKGEQDPEQPFFFLHEYKPEKRRDNDPLGQLLAAMITVQKLNDVHFPLYGCYVIGRLHFFVALNEKEYAVSNGLNASDDDIFQVFRMMRYVRARIEEHFID